MDTPKNNVGRYRFDITYEKPPKDVQARRVEAIRAWLLQKLKREQMEAGHEQREAE